MSFEHNIMINLKIIVNDKLYSESKISSISLNTENGNMKTMDYHANGFFEAETDKVILEDLNKKKIEFTVKNGMIAMLDQHNATLLCNKIVETN